LQVLFSSYFLLSFHHVPRFVYSMEDFCYVMIFQMSTYFDSFVLVNISSSWTGFGSAWHLFLFFSLWVAVQLHYQDQVRNNATALVPRMARSATSRRQFFLTSSFPETTVHANAIRKPEPVRMVSSSRVISYNCKNISLIGIFLYGRIDICKKLKTIDL